MDSLSPSLYGRVPRLSFTFSFFPLPEMKIETPVPFSFSPSLGHGRLSPGAVSERLFCLPPSFFHRHDGQGAIYPFGKFVDSWAFPSFSRRHLFFFRKNFFSLYSENVDFQQAARALCGQVSERSPLSGSSPGAQHPPLRSSRPLSCGERLLFVRMWSFQSFRLAKHGPVPSHPFLFFFPCPSRLPSFYFLTSHAVPLLNAFLPWLRLGNPTPFPLFRREVFLSLFPFLFLEKRWGTLKVIPLPFRRTPRSGRPDSAVFPTW